MRLIDADALTDRMYHDAFETDTDMQKWDSGCWIRYKMFENAIDEQPTIEPKKWFDDGFRLGKQVTEYNNKPKQGEWKHLEGDEWLCSNCGYVVWTEGSWEHPLERGKDYCEHCGARMKGADDE